MKMYGNFSGSRLYSTESIVSLQSHAVSYNYTIMNLDLVIDITSMLHSLLSLLIKALALLFIRLCLEQAKLLCLVLITFV
jgi:hypothetical protein